MEDLVRIITSKSSKPTIEDAVEVFKARNLKNVSDLFDIHEKLILAWARKKERIDW
jgi:hypothetical protein